MRMCLSLPAIARATGLFFFDKAKARNTSLPKSLAMPTYMRCCFIIMFSPLITNTHGQSLQNIKLRVTNVNDFSVGYDRSNHTYKDQYIRAVLTKPSARLILASVLASIPTTRVHQESVEDAGHCYDVEMRLIPARAAAFVWTLKGKNPLTHRVMNIKEVRTGLKAYRPTPGSKCILRLPPGMKPLQPYECKIEFDAPVPSEEVSNAEATYTVQFDILDANNHVLLTQTKNVTVPKRVPLIVSIGESLASGEGNPDVRGKSRDDNYDPVDIVDLKDQKDCEDDATVMINYGTKPDMVKKAFWFDERDHRSLRSGPALAAKEILKDVPYVVFLSFAKSGSSISSKDEDNDILDQLEHVKRVVGDHPIDILHISAGGNDVGFSDVLKTMAKDFRGSGAEKVLSDFINKISILRNEGYPRIPAKIKDLNLNIGKVIINEYPGHVFNDKNGKPARGCGVFTSFRFWAVSVRDAVAMERMGNLLNDEVKLAADKYGWVLVSGISDAFKRHGYCTNDSYYRGATASCDMQGDFNGIMHPNEKGTAVYAQALAREFRRALRRVENVPVHVSH